MKKHSLLNLAIIIALLSCGKAWAAPIDHVYVSNERVDKLNLDGSFDMNFRSPNSDLCRQLAVDSTSGNVWLGCIPIVGINAIFLFDSNGNVINQCNNPTWPSPFFPTPNDLCSVDVYGAMCIDPFSNAWATDRVNDRVWKFQTDGTRLGPFSTGSSPSHIACDPFGNVWTSNNSSNSVSKLANNGSLIGTVPTPNWPVGVAIDADGNAWVPTNDGYVVKISNDMSSVQSLGGGKRLWGWRSCSRPTRKHMDRSTCF